MVKLKGFCSVELIPLRINSHLCRLVNNVEHLEAKEADNLLKNWRIPKPSLKETILDLRWGYAQK